MERKKEKRNIRCEGLIIVRLSGDRKGLLVRTPGMSDKNYWHVHSNEMSRKQIKIHRELIGE